MSICSKIKIIPINKLHYNIKHCISNHTLKNAPSFPEQNNNVSNTHVNGIFSDSYIANTFFPSSISTIKRPWYMNSLHCVYMYTLFGRQFVDTWNISKEKKDEFVLDNDCVYHNDKKIVDEPAVLMLKPGLMYRTLTGDKGATTVSVHTKFPEYDTSLHDYDESITPFLEEDKNTLHICSIDNTTKRPRFIYEYSDHVPINKTEKNRDIEALCKRWNDMAFII